MEYILLMIGFIFLIKGADLFVEGSCNLARFLKVPSVIIGLTIVAMGTSAPEASVSIRAAFTGNNEIALSNIIGSNIFNGLIVVGICAFLASFKTDKTIDAINKKITVINAPVMRISESGGQISFSSASTAVPSGEYKISVEMSNSAGTRVYKDIFVAAIQESDPYWMLDGGEGAYSWNSQVGSWGPIEAAGIYDFKHDPDGENEIEFIVCDKNDNPFSWKDGEIVNRGTERSKLEDVCFETPNYTERSAIFKYPFAPFPFAPGGGEQYQYCYRILGNYLKYDDETRSGYMNLVVNFRVLLDGKWTIKVKFPAITRMPKNG